MRRLWNRLKNAEPSGRSIVIGMLLVVLIFIAASAISEPLPTAARELPLQGSTPTATPPRLTPTPQPAASDTLLLTPTRTPVPPELLENADATDGIIIGTVLLVIIVLAGTIAGINIRRKMHRDE